jgi:hypothetical protein
VLPQPPWSPGQTSSWRPSWQVKGKPSPSARADSWRAEGSSLPGETPYALDPDVTPGAAPPGAREGFELREVSRERSPLTMRNRRREVMTLARHMTAQGIASPVSRSKPVLNRYLLAQYKDRKPVTPFQGLKVFSALVGGLVCPLSGSAARSSLVHDRRWFSAHTAENRRLTGKSAAGAPGGRLRRSAPILPDQRRRQGDVERAVRPGLTA